MTEVRPAAVFVYSFRHSVSNKTLAEMKTFCEGWAKFWIFQQEEGEERKEGEEHGYMHWQGILSLKKPLRAAAAVKTIKASQTGWCPEYFKPEHTPEGGIYKSLEEMKACYATKVQTRVAGPWDSSMGGDSVLPECYDIASRFNEVQSTILKIWGELAPRDILFVHGEAGCCGKSTLAQWMARTMPNVILVPPSMITMEDMVQWVADLIPKSHAGEQWTVLLDVPRGIRGEESWKKFMSVLEMIASGWLYDKRYSAKQIFTLPIKAICFSNQEPQGNNLTLDRFIMLPTDNWIAPYRVNRKRVYNRITQEYDYV